MTFKEHLLRYLEPEFIEELLNSMTENRTNFLVLNTNKMSKDEFKNLFPNIIESTYINNGFYYDKNEYDLGKSFYFDNGLFYILDSASSLVSELLPIEDNDFILDMCAAPGGKTITTSFKNRSVQVLANDINYPRALTLSSNIEKIGLKNVIVTSNTINILNNYYKNTFDKIILDAPCSGSAMFRKSIEMENDWTYEKVLRCQAMQKELLEYAANMLKEGGIISYSTCSFSYEENEEVIINFINNHKEFELINIKEDKAFYRSKQLKEAIHLFPNLYKGEGQFIALLHKLGTLKKKKSPEKYNKYGTKYLEKNKNSLYGYDNDLNTNKLNVLRKGVEIATYKGNNEIPSFNYAHYLDAKDSIKLDYENTLKYLHGEELNIDLKLKNDYYVVSYNNINLGYVHYVNGKLKNLYPKGLRH